MESNRKENSKRNAVVGVLGQVMVMLMQFVCRTVFIRYLSIEYLGINALLTNVLSILSLSELGFSAAFMYSLYKPVADNDVTLITQILYFYKKVYKNI